MKKKTYTNKKNSAKLMKWANDWKIKERGEKNIENCNHMACDEETVEGLENEEGGVC